jgi:hypothetical protein
MLARGAVDDDELLEEAAVEAVVGTGVVDELLDEAVARVALPAEEVNGRRSMFGLGGTGVSIEDAISGSDGTMGLLKVLTTGFTCFTGSSGTSSKLREATGAGAIVAGFRGVILGGSVLLELLELLADTALVDIPVDGRVVAGVRG